MRYTVYVDRRRESRTTSDPRELAEIIEQLAWEYDASMVVVSVCVDKEEPHYV